MTNKDLNGESLTGPPPFLLSEAVVKLPGNGVYDPAQHSGRKHRIVPLVDGEKPLLLTPDDVLREVAALGAQLRIGEDGDEGRLRGESVVLDDVHEGLLLLERQEAGVVRARAGSGTAKPPRSGERRCRFCRGGSGAQRCGSGGKIGGAAHP